MRQAADGTVRVTTESATGKVGFIAARGAGADLYPDLDAGSTAEAVAKVTSYLDRFGPAFGAAKGELVRTKADRGRWGWTVSYLQKYQGVPVFGSLIKANVDTDGDLVSVTGFAAPDLKLSVTPRFTPAQAAERAVSVVKADPPTSEEGRKADTSGVKAVDPALVVYRTGAVRGDTGEALLAYQVQVTNSANVRDMVILDANTNKPVNRYSMMADALDRELYESSPDTVPVWKEGDPFPGLLSPDQQNLVNSSGESYRFYANTFGRDSYDGLGATMKTVNNDPTINCPNANWNGTTTNYCDGVTSDDVVSHEWAHAYTEYTSGLIYQYQSGALNESYSDVWGETVDLVNGREDEGETFEAKRPDGECEPTAPAKLEVAITAPAGVAGPCTATAAGFGPEADAFAGDGVETDVVVATDPSDGSGASTTDGCSPITNAADVAGNYAYLDRGTCSFQTKVNNAKNAGATGLVVGNSVAGLPFSMSGTSTIPGIMVTKADGARVKSAGTVTMTISAEDTSDRTDSSRWLVGEKSTAFGGAIRDMWTPTCYGHPGKVNDAEYNCDFGNTDNGGVHSNSGVPNHAYALVVDGGTYNGKTITGLGIDKAANIWWRAQEAYLTPVSDFTAAADGLEQSCTDLIDQPINQVSTAADVEPVAADPITAADCTQVVDVMAAVEMRADPVQCDFQPLLNKDTPSLCGEGFSEYAVWTEDFEDGLDGWTAEQEIADLGGYQGGFGAPWETTDEAPGNHPGGVAYGPVPDLGDCSGDGENDFSSRDSIISPEIALPSGDVAPVLSFDHYVSTEAGWDGGNIAIKVNDGTFAPIAKAAYLFNAPKTLNTLGAGNSNPLAGQPGFTGTDGGKVTGSWGTSQVDLAQVGIEPGDTITLKVNVGRDGCGGIDPEYGGGWYVDNITISTCRIETTIKARHRPQPSVYGEASTVDVTIDDESATGSVTVTARGKTLGTADVADGAASIPLAEDLRVGRYAAFVTYSGDDTHATATDDVAITVKKAATKTEAVRTHPAKLKKGKRATVVVEVGSDAGQVNGIVRIIKNHKVLGQAKLKNGVAKAKIRLNKVGRVKLLALYLGGNNYGRSHDRFKVRVVR